MSAPEKAYIGRDNVTKRVLRIDGKELTSDEKLAVTRVVVNIGSHCLDTLDSNEQNISYAGGVVSMTIGLIENIRPGKYVGKMTVYDNELANGKAWGSFNIEVYPWSECDGV
jgi:hypothetical protein